MTPSTYSAEFAFGCRATMTIAPSRIDVSWAPSLPKRLSNEQIAAYQIWRNDCLADYAARTGFSIAVVDV